MSVEIRVDDLAPAIQAVGIIRRYAGVLALRGVDLTLQRGERLALIGPNAAGKTTLIRVLATALRPSAGALSICGIDALRHPTAVRRLIGLVSQESYLYGGLTARENLRFYARLYGIAAADARIARVIDEVGLQGRADEPVRNLSRGLMQRASLARAILHEPRLLLLDEPETGLDEAAQTTLGTVLEDWAGQGRSVVLASHRLDWARHITDRALVLDRGAVLPESAAGMPAPDAREPSPVARSTA